MSRGSAAQDFAAAGYHHAPALEQCWYNPSSKRVVAVGASGMCSLSYAWAYMTRGLGLYTIACKPSTTYNPYFTDQQKLDRLSIGVVQSGQVASRLLEILSGQLGIPLASSTAGMCSQSINISSDFSWFSFRC